MIINSAVREKGEVGGRSRGVVARELPPALSFRNGKSMHLLGSWSLVSDVC